MKKKIYACVIRSFLAVQICAILSATLLAILASSTTATALKAEYAPPPPISNFLFRRGPAGSNKIFVTGVNRNNNGFKVEDRTAVSLTYRSERRPCSGASANDNTECEFGRYRFDGGAAQEGLFKNSTNNKCDLQWIYSFKPGGGKSTDIDTMLKALKEPFIPPALRNRDVVSDPNGPHFAMYCYSNKFFAIWLLNIQEENAPGTATAGGAVVWTDTKKQTVGRDGVAGRFIFISPKEIIDTASSYGNGKPVVYSTGADSSVFGTGSNQRPISDGMYAFWPRKEDGSLWERDGDTCHGGFAVLANNESGGYGKVYGVPAALVNGTCYAGDTNSQDISNPANQGHMNPGHDYSAMQQDKYLITDLIGWEHRKLWYSMFHWSSPTELRSYISPGKTLTKMPDADAKSFLEFKLSTPRALTPTTEVWTSPDCSDNKAVLIIENHDKTPTLTDKDTNAGSTRGLFYRKLGAFWGNSYNGGDLSCLLGREIKDNSKLNPASADAPDHVTFIAYPGLGAGNAAGAFGDPGVAAGDLQQAGTGQASGDGKLDCDVSITNPLTWLFCPIVAAASEVIDKLDNAIVKELNVDTQELFSNFQDPTSKGGAYYKVWSNFRTIGLVILVIAALIMVVSQAISVGPFDAYTVKKVMPRILIAIIFMTLSWDICIFLINITNDVSIALRAMIQAPFASLGDASVGGVKSSLAGGFVVGYAGLGLGIVGLLSFVLTALLAVLIAFLVLTIRKMAIIFLVLIAPFAIACYILPNTKKAWDFWWDTFSKALLMFPIIMGFIAIGRVFAATASSQDPNHTSLLTQIVIMIAYFGPYFALPYAFRLAGGAIANIAGIANDRSRGVFDRLKKGRQERTKDRFQRARNNNLWNRNNAVVKKLKLNDLAGFAVAPHSNAAYYARNSSIPFLSSRGRRIAGSIEASKLEQSQKLFQHWNSHGANDKFYRAVGGMYSGFNQDTQRKLIAEGFATGDVDAKTGEVRNIKAKRSLSSEKDFHSMAKVLETSSSDSDRKAAIALRGNAAYTAGLYSDAEMNYADTMAAGAMGLAAHGFFDGQDARSLFELAKETGSEDYAHAVTVTAENIGKGSHPEAKPGYGHEVLANGQVVAGTDIRSDRGWAVAGTLGAGDYSGMKGNALDGNGIESNEFGGILIDMLKVGKGDIKERNNVAAKLRNAGVSESQIKERLKMAGDNFDSVKNTLLSVASGASYASPDVKTQAARILRTAGFGDEVDRYTQALDPATIAQNARHAREGGGETPPGAPGDLGGAGSPPGTP